MALKALLLIFVASLTLVAGQNCPNSISGDGTIACYPWKGSCYCFSATTRYSFLYLARDLADLFCKGANMNLLSIETEAEQNRIDELVDNYPEIIHTYDHWTSGRYNQNTRLFEWVKRTGNENFGSYRPVQCTNAQTCQQTTSTLDPNAGQCVIRAVSCSPNCPTAYWDTADCAFAKPFVCELI